MSNLKTFNQIVNEMIDRLRLVQPSLDTKPGTVSRDLFIDIQADYQRHSSSYWPPRVTAVSYSDNTTGVY